MDGLESLVSCQDGLLHRTQAGRLLSASAISHRLRAGGPWQRVLPAVYATFTGQLTVRQRRRAALLYAGAAAMLGGGTAAAAHGLRAVGGNDPYRRGGADGPCSRVVVLVPHRVRRADTGFVTLARTTRFPEPAILVDGLATCPLTRAVVDACLSLHDIRSVRALVAEAVQRGFTTVDRITPELAAAPSAGS